jgi:uncharacterized protein YndB with AHSA1/START domain
MRADYADTASVELAGQWQLDFASLGGGIAVRDMSPNHRSLDAAQYRVLCNLSVSRKRTAAGSTGWLFFCIVAVRASREVVIDAPPEAVMDALADVEAVPSWSSVHTRAEVIDTYEDGRPHHVMVTVKLMGLIDKEVLEYQWGPDWVVWHAERTSQQNGQHCEYTLKPEGGGTRVRFNITLEPRPPLPEFLVKLGKKAVLDAATEGLRKRVLG